MTLFADIRDFTSHMLTMTPEDLNRDLSGFLDVAVKVVHHHGGMVDKFIGDEVMAIWGYARNRMTPPRTRLRRRTRPSSRGLHTRRRAAPDRRWPRVGTVTLGVVGNESKRQFTAIGPSVNLAARLQVPPGVRQPICIGPDLAAPPAGDARQARRTDPPRPPAHRADAGLDPRPRRSRTMTWNYARA